MFCLSVCLYSIDVKTAEPPGPKICVQPRMTPAGRFMDAQNNKKLSPKIFDFRKTWKVHEKTNCKLAKNFIFVLSTRQC